MKDYLAYNDAKGRDSRVRTQINHSERAKAQLPFEGTLCMSKYDLQRARFTGTAIAGNAQMRRVADHYARNFDR
jgi:hypothetical protein